MQKRFNRYTLTKEIASKPSGSVYLAHRINNASKKVALKVFKATSFTSKQQGQNFLQMVERIRQLRHSSIVPILDLGIEQGHPYVVREYVASSSLRHRLDSLSPQRLDLQEALSIIFQVGQALCYAHAHHILHGNLKPENIFFNDDGEVLLADFGLTSFTNVTKLDDQSDQRTTSYLAPEQLVRLITETSDQYALACLAYELITGCAPFSPQSLSLVVSPLSVNREPINASERQESKPRDQAGPVQTESVCENSQCPDYGKVGNSNVRKYGKTKSGVQRWQCKTCQTTWSSSSMSEKQQIDLIPLTDLVPSLPKPIEEAVLKAMAKDPSKRYADISIFVRTLQIASLLATSPVTNSLIASLVAPLPTRLTMLLEKTQSEPSLSTPLLEHWKDVQNDYHPSKTTTIPNSDTYHPSKTVVKSKIDAHHANNDLVEALPQGRRPQPSQPLAPTLWLAFALSGIILLLGTATLYALVPLRSPGSTGPVKSSPTAQPSVQITNISIAPTLSPKPTPTLSPSPTPTLSPIPTPSPTPTTPRSYEAESPQNTLAGGASVIDCSFCSGGERVGKIGNSGTLQFNNVWEPSTSGSYTLTVYFVKHSDSTLVHLRMNGIDEIGFSLPSDSNPTVESINLTQINLNAGNNTIEFYNNSGASPDIDRIVV